MGDEHRSQETQLAKKTSIVAPHHQDILSKSGIDPDVAESWGVMSALTADDLPSDLSDQPLTVPGLVFPLRKLDGTIYHQIRLDNPEIDDRGKPIAKYRQTRGIGAIITVPAAMKDRVGRAERVCIVEGTKQTLAAVSAAPDDTLVIGVQGSSNWKDEGVPSTDLTRILDAAPDGEEPPLKKVVVVFDADTASNPNVWTAGQKLRETVCTITGLPKDKVLFAKLSALASGSAGLDDLLGSYEPAKRARLFENLLKRAGSLGARPKSRDAGSAEKMDRENNTQWIVDMSKGVILTRTHTTDPNGNKVDIELTKLAAAATIERVESFVDEDNNNQSTGKVLELKVAIPAREGGVRTYTGVRVPDSRLSYIGEWLSSLPGTSGVTVARDTRPNDDIAGAIRECSTNIASMSKLARLGWFLIPGEDEDKWGWVAGNGAMTADGLDPSIVGRPAAADYHKITLEDFDTESTEDMERLARATSNFVNLRNLFNDPMIWDSGIAAFGLAFLPITPNASLAYFGPRSAGKSVTAQGLASALNPKWGPQRVPMASFNASSTAMDLLCSGLDNCFIHVDDFKPESSSKAAERTREALDGLLRRSYGSGGRRRGTVDKDLGGLSVRSTDDAAPLAIITGEEVPVGGEFADSGLDRMVIMPMKPKSTFRVSFGANGESDGGAEALARFYAITGAGEFPVVLAAYLRYISTVIEATPSDDELPATASSRDIAMSKMENFRLMLEEQRTKTVDDLARDHGKELDSAKVSDRARRAVASLLVGAAVFMQFVIDSGFADEETSTSILTSLELSLVDQIISNTINYMDSNRSGGEIVRDEILTLLSSGRACLDEPQSSAQRCIGSSQTYKGVPSVFINPKAVAELVRIPGGQRRITSDLLSLIPNGSFPEFPRKTVNRRVGGTPNVRCVGIPMDIWAPEDEEAEQDAVNAGSDF